MASGNRREARRAWPVRVYRLGEEPGDDLSDATTPEQRLEILDELSRRMWELMGRPAPEYTRSTMPVRVVRRR